MKKILFSLFLLLFGLFVIPTRAFAVNNFIYPTEMSITTSTGFQNSEAVLVKDDDSFATKIADSSSIKVNFDTPLHSDDNIINLFASVYYKSESSVDPAFNTSTKCVVSVETDVGNFNGGGCEFGTPAGYSDTNFSAQITVNGVHNIYSATINIISPQGESQPLDIDFFEFRATATGDTVPIATSGGPYSVEAGQTLVLSASVLAPENDPYVIYWNFDNIPGSDGFGLNPIFTAESLAPGVYPIRMVFSDGINGLIYYIEDTFVNVVAPNNPPQISNMTGDTIIAGNMYFESGSFTDPDSNSWTATVDYGDGSGLQALNLNGLNFNLSHTYSSPGNYSVTVAITDEHNHTGTAEATIAVTNPGPFTFAPIADTYLKQGSPNENEGSSTFMRLQQSGNNRALIKFDANQIQNTIGNMQNYTAQLKLNISDNGNNWGTTGRTIDLIRLTKDWMEGNGFIDGHNPSNRGTISGATWNCATDTNTSNQNDDCSGTTAWKMGNSSLWPFVATPTATTNITNNQSGIVELDVTSDIQSFLNGSNPNYGWLLKKTNEGAAGRIEFGTKESGNNSPELVITAN